MLTKKQKGFSKVLVLIIVLAVIAGGVLAWQYWPEDLAKEQEQPETNGSSQDDVAVLLEELKQVTQLNSPVEDVEFFWNLIGEKDAREQMSIQGKGFELLDTESLNYSKINSFFQNNGFENDMENSGDATVKGARGYRKQNVVCIVSSVSLFDNNDMATNKSDIKVNCGKSE